ncbi:MAG: hypothetical protein KF681_18600 [Bdellovibrionaceae bacterium]|nr:hypothetical protein [Pseudobdellovibrionaceae bacterium]
MAEAYHWKNSIKHSHNWMRRRPTDVVAWKMFLYLFTGLAAAAIIIAVAANRVTGRSLESPPPAPVEAAGR